MYFPFLICSNLVNPVMYHYRVVSSTVHLYGLEKIYPFLNIEKSLIQLVAPTDQEEKQSLYAKASGKVKKNLF